ncbi:MAG: hypothetical protein EXX96DRAFT_578769 [Benjaminiella poitrasii]|nr:MAG: hypothetical protein EXX96DRAFT_578769 [Benjaminiella poitrasii]
MKFNSIFAVTSMFVAGALAKDNFELSNLNGTWNLGGLTSSVLSAVNGLIDTYKLSINCPQIFITGYENDTVYIQPSFRFGWFNNNTQTTTTTNITLSGLLSLDNSSSETEGDFKAELSIPTAAAGQEASQVHMLNAAFIGGSHDNPLPHGADFSGDISVKLASTSDKDSYDALLLTLSNLKTGSSEFVMASPLLKRSSSSDDEYQLLLIKNDMNSYNESDFNDAISALDEKSNNITYLGNTCSA